MHRSPPPDPAVLHSAPLSYANHTCISRYLHHAAIHAYTFVLYAYKCMPALACVDPPALHLYFFHNPLHCSLQLRTISMFLLFLACFATFSKSLKIQQHTWLSPCLTSLLFHELLSTFFTMITPFLVAGCCFFFLIFVNSNVEMGSV